MPKAALPPVIPFTLQLTPVFVVLVTDARNVCVLPNKTVPLGGEIVT